MFHLAQQIARRFGLSVMRNSTFDGLVRERDALAHQSAVISAIDPRLMHGLTQTRSQLKQEIFVLAQTAYKKGGFFVEFGATDGVEGSNTLLLEREYGWTGILAEPARVWHNDLKRNRSVFIDHSCVFSTTGEQIVFREVAGDAQLSTALAFANSDHHSASRGGIDYSVPTITLHDLLVRHHAPRTIDYLSIDTEGSEYEILKAFDFSAFDIQIITCEHNYSAAREKVHALLSANRYRRVHESVSGFDDWYLRD